MTLDIVSTTHNNTPEEDEQFKAPAVPHDLFAGKRMPTLKTGRLLKGELSITVKIPEDLYSDLTLRDERGRTTVKTLHDRALAHRKLLNFLNNYRWALNEDNVLEISDDKTINPLTDLPRVRRAITALEIEVSDEIDRLYRWSHKLKYGSDYQFVIDSPTQ
ncbi:hypothetical protein [Actinomyces bowdenii]|uniref:Uncharacterized protein n=1 Tax=Actinomyces bowdenii TaxID=131109 RepID=A0A3P1V714_9ACTO|nr:hypothetical protein [Actinomyces bowdenii]RRD29290.1 hypothetical protein EII10_07220 [Actinomyces bowdenii]